MRPRPAARGPGHATRVLALASLLSSWACGPREQTTTTTESSAADADTAAGPSAAQPSAAQPNSNYAAALETLDAELDVARARADELGGWSDHELVARLHRRRAQLSGAIEDWAAADRALDAAFSRAPEGGGPVFTRLELDLSLHRLDDAEARLAQAEAAPLRTGEQSIRLSLARGELAAQRGQLDGARVAYELAGRLGAAPEAVAAHLALLAQRRGEHTRARDLLDSARTSHDGPQRQAFLSLQRGLIEWSRGRAEAALDHYEQAEAAFSGWWLVTEHRAEALAALERRAEAEQLYRGVIEQTHNPEFMDALAELLRERDPEAARRWTLDAAAAHTHRVALLPRAAGAHALDHRIAHAAEDPQTLAAARTAAAEAPHEHNLARLADLALTLGEIDEARAALAQARSQGAVNPELDQLEDKINSAQVRE